MVSCAPRHPLPESTARTFHEGGVAEKRVQSRDAGPEWFPKHQHGVNGFDAAKCASRAAGVAVVTLDGWAPAIAAVCTVQPLNRTLYSRGPLAGGALSFREPTLF